VTDWRQIDWILTRGANGEGWNGVSPAQIDRLTLAEIDLLLDDGKSQSNGMPLHMSDAQIDAYAARRARMTPLEKVRAALEERGW
jgi:hypothetical protein